MQPERTGRSAADNAYRAIRRLIVTVAIPPGGAFTEGELVERLRLGKTPVREALLRLKAESLITGQPRAGYRAAAVTLKDVRDTCRVLSDMEARTCERAAGNGGTHAILRHLQDQADDGAASDDAGKTTDAWIQADRRFHLALANAQDNQVQADITARLSESVLRFRYLSLALGVPGSLLAHRHDELLDAVEKGSAGGAAAAACGIWRESESSLVALLSTADSVQSTNVALTRDKNTFYLDAAPPGPTIPDVFQSRLRPGTNSSPSADGPAPT